MQGHLNRQRTTTAMQTSPLMTPYQTSICMPAGRATAEGGGRVPGDGGRVQAGHRGCDPLPGVPPNGGCAHPPAVRLGGCRCVRMVIARALFSGGVCGSGAGGHPGGPDVAPVQRYSLRCGSLVVFLDLIETVLGCVCRQGRGGVRGGGAESHPGGPGAAFVRPGDPSAVG